MHFVHCRGALVLSLRNLVRCESANCVFRFCIVHEASCSLKVICGVTTGQEEELNYTLNIHYIRNPSNTFNNNVKGDKHVTQEGFVIHMAKLCNL